MSVSIGGGIFRTLERIDTSPESFHSFFTEGRRTPQISFSLTAEQRDESNRIEQRHLAVVRDEIRGIAKLLASKPDCQILGPAEFQVRDRVHTIGAQAIETALEVRKARR